MWLFFFFFFFFKWFMLLGWFSMNVCDCDGTWLN
ncbi:LOW QUALITY PROTEIN: hypothetical protein TorRG33x02_148620 [Trema orientale]|uniref:Uncharacterized protein n=1 Tax=Trema orientale TaxID=63057 RepID=A0A2P5EUV1_TREOI|nr:LOW QUALITY PROTEIN: hypothetical protein TorRG33x02_148620 [Trema orientale]